MTDDIQIAPGVSLPKWLVESAAKIDQYMMAQGFKTWAVGGIQSRSTQEDMTDEEARSILKDGSTSWIEWDQQKDAPCWAAGFVILDGDFTKEQLLAILHFADRAK